MYAGLVGCRFEKSGLMESSHMLVETDSHLANMGYGKVSLVNCELQ